MRITTFVGAVALMLTLLPTSARADWFVAPYIGGQFDGAANMSFVAGADADTQPWNVGVGGGWMKGWFGVEGDLAYYPKFFDNSGGFLTESSVMTLMGNARAMVPLGERLQPFAVAGVGMITPNLSEPGGLATVDDSKFGWNVGGGVTGFFTDRVGIQGDVRYFRGMDDEGAANPFGIDFDSFDFVRASVGVAFKW